MKKYSLYSVLKNVFMLLLIATLTVSCSNSASSEEETHPEPTGVVLYLNGDLIVEKYSGQDLINNFPPIEKDSVTALINTLFIDEDGNEFIPDEPEAYLNFEISNTNIIEIEQHEGELWDFHVKGRQAGTTTLTLQLMHDNHPDFESPAISIQVVESTVAKISADN